MNRGTTFWELHGGKAVKMRTNSQAKGKNLIKGMSHLKKQMSQ